MFVEDKDLLGIYAGNLDNPTAETLLNKIQTSDEFAQLYRDTPVNPMPIEERFGVPNNRFMPTEAQATNGEDNLDFFRDSPKAVLSAAETLEAAIYSKEVAEKFAEEFAQTIDGLYDDDILAEVEGGTHTMDELLTMMDGTHPKMQDYESNELAGLKRLKMILSGKDPEFDTRRLGSNALELQQIIEYQGSGKEDASNRAIEAGLNMGKEIPTLFPSEYMFEGYRAGGRTRLI